jgi:hypothetical protein
MSTYGTQDVWNTWKWECEIILHEFHLTRCYSFTNCALLPIFHILTILRLMFPKRYGKFLVCFHRLTENNFWWTIFQVHFGVNSGASRFALENQAVNEATFRCPDELGWKPQVALLSYCIPFIISTHFLLHQVSSASLLICRESL